MQARTSITNSSSQVELVQGALHCKDEKAFDKLARAHGWTYNCGMPWKPSLAFDTSCTAVSPSSTSAAARTWNIKGFLRLSRALKALEVLQAKRILGRTCFCWRHGVWPWVSGVQGTLYRLDSKWQSKTTLLSDKVLGFRNCMALL